MLKTKSPNSDDAFIGLTQKEIENFSIVRMINAQLSGDWHHAGFELEASNAVADLLGRAPIGSFVPYDVMAAGAFQRDVTSTTSPGLIATDHEPGSLIHALQNASVVARVGATVMPGLVGNVDVPRQEDSSTAAWIDSENYSGTDESTPTYTAMSMNPKTMRVRIDVSRRMLKQSQPRIDSLLKIDIGAAMGQAIDEAAIIGTGVAPIPQGIRGANGVNNIEIATDGGAITWEHLVAMETALGNHQQLQGKAYVINTATLGALKTTPRHISASVGGFLMTDNGLVNGHPCFVSNTLPNTLAKGNGIDLSCAIFGAWSSLMVAMWGGLDLEADKVTLGNSGGIVLRGFQDIDLGLRYPGAFTVIDDIMT